MEYTWKIESVDAANKTMVVKYASGERETRLNIPLAPADVTTETWVQTYVPVAQLEEPSQSLPEMEGLEGSAVYTPPAEPEAVEPVPEQPDVVGSVNEEYIRALIYQVLEEIKESQA